MAPRNTQKWDAKVHEDILIEVFHNVTIPSGEIQKLMTGLAAKGYTFSESALRQHIQKLRRARDTSKLDGSKSGTPGTPTKAATPSRATPKKTPRSAAKRKAAQDDEDDDDDEMFDFSGDFVKKEEPGGGSGDEFVPPTPTKAMGSPTKKTRKAGTPKTNMFFDDAQI